MAFALPRFQVAQTPEVSSTSQIKCRASSKRSAGPAARRWSCAGKSVSASAAPGRRALEARTRSQDRMLES